MPDAAPPSPAAGRTFSATDGTLVLTLVVAEEGGYTVTSPMEPGLVTEAETIEAAFDSARDALDELRAARRDLARRDADLLRQVVAEAAR